MKMGIRPFVWGAALAAGALALSLNPAQAGAQQAAQQQNPMGFFITSVGVGDGGNLGGLEGADRHCQSLATAVGMGERVWRAYLSQTAVQGQPAVHARDRIGAGPWHNARGQLIAANVEDLHGDVQRDRNSINKEFALNEKAEIVNARGDSPNRHDILTGSDSHGRALEGDAADTTCNNWSSSSTGQAMVGHHDRAGGGNSSWNAAHMSRGCSQGELVATGGDGLFYCFAIS